MEKGTCKKIQGKDNFRARVRTCNTLAYRSEKTTAVGELFLIRIPHVSTVENRKPWKNIREITIIIHQIQKLWPALPKNRPGRTSGF